MKTKRYLEKGKLKTNDGYQHCPTGAKILNKILVNGIQHCILKMHPNHGRCILRIQGWFNNIKSINIIHYTTNGIEEGKKTQQMNN